VGGGGTRASFLLLSLGLPRCIVDVCLSACSAAQVSAASWDLLMPGRRHLQELPQDRFFMGMLLRRLQGRLHLVHLGAESQHASSSPVCSDIPLHLPAKGAGGDFVSLLQTVRPEEGSCQALLTSRPKNPPPPNQGKACLHPSSLQEWQNHPTLSQQQVEWRSSSVPAVAHDHPMLGCGHLRGAASWRGGSAILQE